MPVILIPAAPALTAEEIAEREVAQTLAALAQCESVIARTIAQERANGAARLYASVTHANAVFTRLRALGGREAVVALVRNDLALRTVLEAHEPGSGISPVPSGMVVVPLDAQGATTEDIAAAADFTVIAIDPS